MKKLFYLAGICAIAAPLTFTSCSDDDDNPVTPAKSVSNLSFTDTDEAEGKIGGTLAWTLPDTETNIDGYVIYLGGTATEKKTKAGETPRGATSYEIPAGTALQAYLIVVARNAAGESANIAALAITDNVATVEEPQTKGGFYILNSGNWNENNASLSYYDYATGTLSADVYKKANGKGLGDGAEQLLVYGSKMYVTVPGSNRLAVLDMEAKEIKSITPAGGEPMNPRCMAADGGKVYVSYYYGHSVAVLDTASLEIEKEVKTGRYPEQLAIANGRIYVANSGGLDYPDYGKTVSVINRETFAVEKEIDVIINPTQLIADSQGDIYVISMGDYGDVKNTLQRIDGQSDEVTQLSNATSMALVNDELYTLYGQWGDSRLTFKKYNALTEEVISDNFIQDASAISPGNSPVLAVDPASGQLLILEAPYGSTSSLYLFTPGGTPEGEAIDTGGYASKWIAFVNK